MEKDSTEWLLAITVDEIHEAIQEICKDLGKAERVTAAARRIRKTSIKLQKLLKDFRKLSCLAGLK